MKMRKVMAAAGLTAVMILVGCGGNTGGDAGQTQEAEETVQENTDQTDTEESGQEESEQAEKTENDQTEQSEESAGGAETSESADGAETYEDNFAVDSEAVTAFADRIKEAVAAKDLEALADLTSFPVYVGLPDTDGAVNTREDFLALGADQVFTDELLASVEEADMSGQEPSMAGFVVAGESGRPNIIFGVVDGKLAVTGINY